MCTDGGGGGDGRCVQMEEEEATGDVYRWKGEEVTGICTDGKGRR